MKIKKISKKNNDKKFPKFNLIIMILKFIFQNIIFLKIKLIKNQIIINITKILIFNKKENLISNKTNVSKTQTYLKNKKNAQSNSQDKIFNNYYYNLMIKDDDVHKINVNLKKFP